MKDHKEQVEVQEEDCNIILMKKGERYEAMEKTGRMIEVEKINQVVKATSKGWNDSYNIYKISKQKKENGQIREILKIQTRIEILL